MLKLALSPRMPSVMALSRQKVPGGADSAENLGGRHELIAASGPAQVTISPPAPGSIAVAARALEAQDRHPRLHPCWELFAFQSPPTGRGHGRPRSVAVEAVGFGWERFIGETAPSSA